MSNLFILIKCNKKYVPDSIMRKITPYAILYNFLWVGGNSIKNYHTHQYSGQTRKLNLFKKEVSKVLKSSKLCFSILSGNKSDKKYLGKPSEHDYYVLKNNDIQDLNKKKILKEKLKSNKYLLKIISKLKKIKNGYYLPISMTSIIKEHPIKITYNVFITLNNKNIVLYSENKYALRNTKIWLNRLSKLIKALKC